MPSAKFGRGSGSEHAPVNRRPATQSHDYSSRQALICAVFDASVLAVDGVACLVPEVDRDRSEYAVASVLLEEAWLSER